MPELYHRASEMSLHLQPEPLIYYYVHPLKYYKPVPSELEPKIA
jgi:hypothetical protein